MMGTQDTQGDGRGEGLAYQQQSKLSRKGVNRFHDRILAAASVFSTRLRSTRSVIGRRKSSGVSSQRHLPP